MKKLGLALVASVALFAPSARAADGPVGMGGMDGRLGLMTRSRNLALSDGAHVVGGKWFVIDANVHYSLIDSLREDRGSFRIGDYLGAGFGVGYGSADNGNAADKFWYSLPLRGGIQTAIRFDRNVDVGLRGWGELRLEPFPFVGLVVEGWARVGAIVGKVNYGWYSNEKTDASGPRGHSDKTFAIGAGFTPNEIAFFGVELDRLSAKDGDGSSVTQWAFLLNVGLLRTKG